MGDAVTLDGLRAWVIEFARLIEENRSYLTDLDSAIRLLYQFLLFEKIAQNLFFRPAPEDALPPLDRAIMERDAPVRRSSLFWEARFT